MIGINSSTTYTCVGIAVPTFAEECDRFVPDSTAISLSYQFQYKRNLC
jgi:hypothetical protein